MVASFIQTESQQFTFLQIKLSKEVV